MNDILSADLIKEWGLQSQPKEKQLEMTDRIGKMIYQAVLVKALDILSDKEQTEFDSILDNNASTPNDVLAFLKSKIPTFEQLVAEEKNNLKNDLLLTV